MNIPLRQPLKWGRTDELRQLAHVLIRVELADGSVGFAEAPPRPSIYGETQATILHIVNDVFAPMLAGVAVNDFDSVAALAKMLDAVMRNNCAKGALDMALHHALSRAQGRTLAAYLGCSQGRIQLSSIVSTGTAEQVKADVRVAYDASLRVFKVKIGKDLPRERETIAQLMSAWPQAQIYVDANQTLSEANAAALLDDLWRLGVIHCEEPLPIHLIEARGELRKRCRMPIIADDCAFTTEDLQRELALDNFDILNIKTARTGFSHSRAMLQICEQEGKGVMIGSQASSLLGCLQAATFAAQTGVTCASECSFYLKTEADLSSAPPIVDGGLRLDDVQASLDVLSQRLEDSNRSSSK